MYGGKQIDMRILLINPILYTAETDEIPKVTSIKDTMIYALCLGFLENGDIPVLIAASDYKPAVREDYPFEIVWMDTALKKLFKPRCLPWLPALGAYIKQNRAQIDGIISSEVFSLCSLTAVRKAPGKTIIWHELGAHNKIMHYIPSKIWYHIVARIFFRKTQIIARSQRASQFIGRFCPRVSGTIIDHGVNLHEIYAKEEKENRFVAVSQLIARKRIDRIIAVFADFIRQEEGRQNYILDIIGTGDKEQELKDLVRHAGITENVIFHGKLSHQQMAPLVAGAKAMLVYTEKDNSMVSIAESIAAGTPVVTTSVPFNSFYIKKEHLGIVKDEWNKDDLDRICRQNSKFVRNCMAYRGKLSAAYGAGQFVDIFQKSRIQ